MRHQLFEEEDPNKKAGGGSGGDLGSVEDRAKRMGWVPQDEFRGEASKWVDAATFVKNGEESLPILRERLRTMERSLAEQARTSAEAKKFYEGVESRAYEKAKRELEAKVATAAKAGDDATATAAAKELAELEGDRAKAAAKGDDDPQWNAWIAQNPWYTSDPELALEAEAMAFKLRKKGEKAEGAPFLEKVKDELKKQFPAKFGNPRRAAGSGVEGAGGAGSGGGGSGGKKSWSDLPAEAKQAGERFIKAGYVKDKETYARQYFEEQQAA